MPRAPLAKCVDKDGSLPPASLLLGRVARQARWFSVHSFANLLVVATSIKSVLVVMKDPFNAMDSRIYHDRSVFGSASPWPIYIVNAVHVYHMLAFRNLTSADYFHHLMFIPTVGFLGQTYEWGALRNFLCFFISGLPGGVDYLMLTLVKHKQIDVMLQKRMCAAINVWLRNPGITYEVAIMWMAWLYERSTVPPAVILLVASLSWFNAQYYNKQAVANYAIAHVFGRTAPPHRLTRSCSETAHANRHVEERISVTTGLKVPEWGPEAKKPQNTMS